MTPRAFDRLRRLWSGWRGHCVSAYFSRHVSGVGTLKSGVDRVDGVYLSMSSEHHSRDEKGTTRSPAGPSKLKVSWFGKVRPCLLPLVLFYTFFIRLLIDWYSFLFSSIRVLLQRNYFKTAENLNLAYIKAHLPLSSWQSTRHFSSTSFIISSASSSLKSLRNEFRANNFIQSYKPEGISVNRGFKEIWMGSKFAATRS